MLERMIKRVYEDMIALEGEKIEFAGFIATPNRKKSQGTFDEYRHDWYDFQEQCEYGDAVLARS